jgi:ankyrin repeat protein
VRGGTDDATPLHTAAWHDQADAASVLLDHGADINILSGRMYNNSPIGWAIVGGSVQVVELLLARGARVTDDHRATAVAGANGAFRQYARTTPPGNRLRIRTRIEQA